MLYFIYCLQVCFLRSCIRCEQANAIEFVDTNDFESNTEINTCDLGRLRRRTDFNVPERFVLFIYYR